MVAISEVRPISTMPIMAASPSWVPAMLMSPARVPWVMLFAMMSETVGPGTIVIATHAAT